MNELDLNDFGTRYAAAWSSQDAASFASFYAEDGILTVNDGEPSIGRSAIAAKAQSFMTAFPDMLVEMVRMDKHAENVVFNWLWTGTNTGFGGTGKYVRITGYEEWIIDRSGHIAESKGYYDKVEYERQLSGGAQP
jgi:steroid delta-isomerase-like uncharacterized protein